VERGFRRRRARGAVAGVHGRGLRHRTEAVLGLGAADTGADGSGLVSWPVRAADLVARLHSSPSSERSGRKNAQE
jgi:hypothetical protein